MLSPYLYALWQGPNDHVLAIVLRLTGSGFTVMGPGLADKNAVIDEPCLSWVLGVWRMIDEVHIPSIR